MLIFHKSFKIDHTFAQCHWKFGVDKDKLGKRL